MKKLLLFTTCIFVAGVINSQSLDEIVKNFTVANKYDKVGTKKTLKITAKMSMMGMDIPVEMWMKNPNKFKSVTNMGGQDMIQVYDGVKGYIVNPMAGPDPVEMTADQVKQAQRSNLFQNYVQDFLRNGQLALAGEESVAGKPAFKIKANVEGVDNMYLYIDKATYLLAKTSLDVNQGGMALTVESYPTDYTETDGVLLPMKTKTSASGMEYDMVITKVEVDTPMEDSIFQIKK
jgi:hypothetical protein